MESGREVRRCSNCGAVLGQRDRFCWKCGAGKRPPVASGDLWWAAAIMLRVVIGLLLVGLGVVCGLWAVGLTCDMNIFGSTTYAPAQAVGLGVIAIALCVLAGWLLAPRAAPSAPAGRDLPDEPQSRSATEDA